MDEKKETAAGEKEPASSQEQLQDLKAAREARGLSLSDVFKTTRVSMNNLTAVENGDFHLLPPPVYTRNFIRKYARAVGIDEKPLLQRYEKHLESLIPPREDPGVQKPWPETGRRYLFLFGSLAVIIVAGILVYALFLYDRSGRPIPAAETTESPLIEQGKSEPAPAAAPTVAVAPTAPPTPAARPAPTAPAAPAISAIPAVPPTSVAKAPATPVPSVQVEANQTGERTASRPSESGSGKMLHLVVEARELTWVRIAEDRNTPYQVLLKPGDRIERLASDYFLIDIGNAAGVNLIYQGKSLGTLGKQGQVMHLRLPEKAQEKRSP